MRSLMLIFSLKRHLLWSAVKDEDGWDPAEYAAVLLIVGLALTAGVGTLASGINNAVGYFVTQVSAMGSGGAQIRGH
jgi:Flp pilus assembly pilin Flp